MLSFFDRLIAFGSRRRVRGTVRLQRIFQGGHATTLIRCRTRDGLTIAIDPNAYIDGFVLRDGYYEREVLDAVCNHLADGGVLWDIGANFGLHALTAKKLRPGATVVAFEPAPFLAARILANCELTGLDVRVLPFALGANACYAELSLAERGNPGLCSFNPWPDVHYDRTVMSWIERADRLIELGVAPAPSVVKIDVEGYEDQVLEGFGQHLANTSLQAIVFEADHARVDMLSQRLIGHGFRISSLAATSQPDATNFLAYRRP